MIIIFTRSGKWIAFAVAVIATVIVSIINPAVGIGMARFCFKAALSGMLIGGIAGGIVNAIQRKDFWDGLVEGAIYGFIDAYTSAAIFYGISAAANGLTCNGPNCFIAGTLVLCRDQDGNECYKPIEDVEVGDYVWAYNEETGESDWKPVVRLFRNETKEWYHIHAAGEEIICTPNHPFYVIGKGFVEAKDLKVSDILLKSNGVQVSIDSIEIEKLKEAETTYNFEVADFHTYFVTENNILVHNKCILDQLGVKDFNEVGAKYTPDELIDRLDELGYTKTIESARTLKSGPATIMDNGKLSFRIMANPLDGRAYFRVFNIGHNPLGANAQFPHWATKSMVRRLTHFYFGG